MHGIKDNSNTTKLNFFSDFASNSSPAVIKMHVNATCLTHHTSNYELNDNKIYQLLFIKTKKMYVIANIFYLEILFKYL